MEEGPHHVAVRLVRVKVPVSPNHLCPCRRLGVCLERPYVDGAPNPLGDWLVTGLPRRILACSLPLKSSSSPEGRSKLSSARPSFDSCPSSSSPVKLLALAHRRPTFRFTRRPTCHTSTSRCSGAFCGRSSCRARRPWWARAAHRALLPGNGRDSSGAWLVGTGAGARRGRQVWHDVVWRR